MSLVNKMLRDLDARRAGEGDRAGLPAAVTPLAARQEPSRFQPWLWFFLLLTFAGLIVVVWYASRDVRSESPAAAPAPPVATAAHPVSTPSPTPPPAVTPLQPPSAPDLDVAPDTSPTPLRMAEQLAAAPAPAAVAEQVREPVPALPKSSAVPRQKEVEQAPMVAPTPKPLSVPADLKASAKPATSSPQPARPLLPTSAPLATANTESSIDKQVRLPSPADRAEVRYRQGVLAQRQGDLEQAGVSFQAALTDYPEHAAARQALSALLIEATRFDEAEELLRKGVELAPVRLASTLALARLMVERKQVDAALLLLQKNAASGERSAEYQGFVGALLNRGGRATEAVERYQAATRLAPQESRWWAGLGIALESAGRTVEAREAFMKARSLPGLPPDLAQHIARRLR